MYTAMLTVENIHGAHHDIWSVNVEEEYHESTDGPSEASEGRTGRAAPIIPRSAAQVGSTTGGTNRSGVGSAVGTGVSTGAATTVGSQVGDKARNAAG